MNDIVCSVELVYARDVIPHLYFKYQPKTYYPPWYVQNWREHLMDVWGRTDAIGLKLSGLNYTRLAHPDDMWFTSKKGALKWAKEAGLKVVNPDDEHFV